MFSDEVRRELIELVTNEAIRLAQERAEGARLPPKFGSGIGMPLEEHVTMYVEQQVHRALVVVEQTLRDRIENMIADGLLEEVPA